MELRHIPLFFGIILMLSSCGASRKRIAEVERTPEASTEIKSESKGRLAKESDKERVVGSSLALEISENARAFLGTDYRYGGTTREGMDCSGLIYTAFLEENIELPRISREMSLLGSRLYLREVGIGDLLFFETDKNKKVINHVGLVVETHEEEIFFIHSSSSQGVIISSLKNPYWEEHFVMARRVL